MSLDGFIETPSGDLDWVVVDEELHRYFNDEARDQAVFLYGRRMYELMAGYWPTADEDPSLPAYMAESARIWREKPKVVFSRTLDRVAWDSRLVRGDVGKEIARLKAQPGGDLGVVAPASRRPSSGSGSSTSTGSSSNRSFSAPGTRFFPPLEAPLGLRLVETTTFGSGVVLLSHRRADGD